MEGVTIFWGGAVIFWGGGQHSLGSKDDPSLDSVCDPSLPSLAQWAQLSLLPWRGVQSVLETVTNLPQVHMFFKNSFSSFDSNPDAVFAPM